MRSTALAMTLAIACRKLISAREMFRRRLENAASVPNGSAMPVRLGLQTRGYFAPDLVANEVPA